MRRLAPWALLGLLTVGAVAGIALGVADEGGSTAEQWVARAYTTTDRAGTARFTALQVTSSGNPELRSSVSTTGVLDFTHGALHMTMVDRPGVELNAPNTGDTFRPPNLSIESTALGRSLYMGFDYGGGEHWSRTTIPQTVRSILYPEGISVTLIPPGFGDLSPAVAVRDLGEAVVEGETTTKYAVSVGPLPVCPGTKTAVSTHFTEYPRTVWIDRAGRIVQVRSVVRQGSAPPSPRRRQSTPATTTTTERGELPLFSVGSRAPFGTVTTTTTTIRLSDFGAPVSIKAPPAPAPHFGPVSVSKGEAKSTSCPSVALLVGG